MPSFTRQEFQALFVSERDKLFRMLMKLTGNAQDAEDLLQETFLTAWRKREQFDGRGAPEGFLRTTCLRLFLNARTRSSRRPPAQRAVDDELTSPPRSRTLEAAEAREFLLQRVREELDQLTPEAREAFILFRFEGLSCGEIGARIGVPSKTVQTRLRRATLALAARLEPFRELFLAS